MADMSRPRELRQNQTDAERSLWAALRRGRLAGRRFRRQHPLGAYIVDFVCLDANLVVEVDGNHHAEQRGYDESRDRWLAGEGFRVLSFSDREVLTRGASVEEAIWVVLNASPPPQPSPLKGEGAESPRPGRSKRKPGDA